MPDAYVSLANTREIQGPFRSVWHTEEHGNARYICADERAYRCYKPLLALALNAHVLTDNQSINLGFLPLVTLDASLIDVNASGVLTCHNNNEIIYVYQITYEEEIAHLIKQG